MKGVRGVEQAAPERCEPLSSRAFTLRPSPRGVRSCIKDWRRGEWSVHCASNLSNRNPVDRGCPKLRLPWNAGAQNWDLVKEFSRMQVFIQVCEKAAQMCSDVLRDNSGSAQVCTATAQGCLLTVQVKTASAQV